MYGAAATGWAALELATVVWSNASPSAALLDVRFAAPVGGGGAAAAGSPPLLQALLLEAPLWTRDVARADDGAWGWKAGPQAQPMPPPFQVAALRAMAGFRRSERGDFVTADQLNVSTPAAACGGSSDSTLSSSDFAGSCGNFGRGTLAYVQLPRLAF